MPEKPKKKVAGLSVSPAARRAAAARNQQRGADVFGGDVDEIVSRSFVGQGVAQVAAVPAEMPPLGEQVITPPPPPPPPAAAPTDTIGTVLNLPVSAQGQAQSPNSPETPRADPPHDDATASRTTSGVTTDGLAETASAETALAASSGARGPAEMSAQARSGADIQAQAAGQSGMAPLPATQPTARSGAGVPAREVVLKCWTESTMDLKLGKNRWQTIPFRFAPDLVTALAERVAHDREVSGKHLTVAQYVDAAMRTFLPTDTEAQLALAEDFFIRREGNVPAGKQSSHRVSPDVYHVVSKLPNDLRKAGRSRTAVHVFSAVVDLFLAALNEQDPIA